MYKKYFFILTLFLFINIASANPLYYKVNLYYDKGEIKINSWEIVFSNTELKNLYNPNYFDNYSIILSSSNQKLENIKFSAPNIMIYETVDENGKINGSFIKKIENKSFFIYVPYHQNSNELIVYKDDSELARKDVSMYSKETLTGIKDDRDSHGCSISAGYSWCAEKQKCIRTWEEECYKEDDFKDTKSRSLLGNISDYWWILFVLLMILILILIYTLKKPVKKKR
ncbi:MAG: hypothetical protein Q8N99_07965 [Nanoarchaeota archaeon]|nr:hypothetical protein [Nanoarchaeota archaeon]